MPQLITIGETMAAFTPDSVGALRYVQNFGIRTAGAESNVAVGLAKLGLEAAWVSRLGTDEFGCFIRNQLRAEGVDCSRVIYDPDHRTGIMFKETGVGETKVFYYRENSAASHLCPEDVTPALLDGVKVLHMSGITPVLSESCLAMTKAAFALAKEKGVAISFDPNIRRKLWRGQDYAPLIRELTLQSEIVLLGLDEADALFGLRDPDAIFDLLFRDGCAQYVAIKDGGNGAWVADKTTREKLPPYPCKPIEPIGAGDGFNAGFLAVLRVYRILAATEVFPWVRSVLLVVGVLSLAIGALFLRRTNNYKRFLAYSTVECMGLSVVGLGVGGIGIFAALLQVIAHALIKSGMFVQMAQVGKVYGTYRMNRIGGYIGVNRTGAVALLLGGMSLLAFPPSVLFVSEMMILRQVIESGRWWLLVLLALLLCFVMFSFCSRILKLCYKPVGNPLPMPSLRIHLGLTWCGLLLIAGASVLGIVQPPFLIKFINAVIAF